MADNFYYISGPADLINHFQEIEYSFTTASPEETSVSDNGYYFLGSETIGGTRANKIRLNLGGKYRGDWMFWLDGNGAPIKCTKDGIEVVDDLELFTANLAYNSFPGPFVIVTAHFQSPLVSDEHLKFSRWRLVSERAENRDLGAGSMKVSIYEFEGDEGESFYFEIAEIKGKNMYINYQVSRANKASYNFTITRLIPR